MSAPAPPRPGPRHSLTFRLTLLFASVSTLVLLALGTLIAEAVERHFADQDMDILNARFAQTQALLARLDRPGERDALAGRLDESLLGHPGLAVVVEHGGQTFFASSGAGFPAPLLERTASPGTPRASTWTLPGGQPQRGFVAWASPAPPGANAARIGVAIDISHHLEFMRAFRVTLWSFVALAALLTGLLGWVAVRRELEPLQAIRRLAADVTAKRLDVRLAAAEVPVELRALVDTLNAMLDRLERSFSQLNAFSSDIAHELRTPLSNLLTQSQVCLAQERNAAEYRDALASNIEECERLSRMIADMLFLARAEHGQIVPRREAVDLAREADALLEFYAAPAGERQVTLGRDGHGAIEGDRLMLQRALGNLLSNALRHTPAGGHVRVTVESRGAQLDLTVENSGEPIPPEQLPRLFDRFYRADSARSRPHEGEGEGTGLGLAIVRSIARAHGGDALVSSAGGLTRFVLRLPNRKLNHS